MNNRILLSLAGVIALTACGGSDKEPTGPGGGDPLTSYQATFSGDVVRSLSGNAAFASDNSGDDVGFALGLVDAEEEDADDMIVFYRAQAGIPGTGTMQVADYMSYEDETEIPASELVAWAFLDLDSQTPLWCAATSGSVTVQSASSSKLKGTFSMEMACMTLTSETSEKTVTVTGNFDAAGGNVSIPTS